MNNNNLDTTNNTNTNTNTNNSKYTPTQFQATSVSAALLSHDLPPDGDPNPYPNPMTLQNSDPVDIAVTVDPTNESAAMSATDTDTTTPSNIKELEKEIVRLTSLNVKYKNEVTRVRQEMSIARAQIEKEITLDIQQKYFAKYQTQMEKVLLLQQQRGEAIAVAAQNAQEAQQAQQSNAAQQQNEHEFEEQLREEMEVLNNRVTDVETNDEVRAEELHRMQQRIVEITQEVMEWKKKFAKSQETVQNLTKSAVEAKDKNEKVLTEWKNKFAHSQETAKKTQEYIEELKEEKEAFMELSQELKRTENNLRTKMATYVSRIKEYQNHATKNVENVEIKEEMLEWKRKFANSENTVQKLKESVEELKEEKEAFEQQLLRQQRNNQREQQQHVAIEIDAGGNEVVAAGNADELAVARLTIERLQQSNDALTQSNHALKEEKEKFEKLYKQLLRDNNQEQVAVAIVGSIANVEVQPHSESKTQSQDFQKNDQANQRITTTTTTTTTTNVSGDWQNVPVLDWDAAEVQAWVNTLGPKLAKWAACFSETGGYTLVTSSEKELDDIMHGAPAVRAKVLLKKIVKMMAQRGVTKLHIQAVKERTSQHRAPGIVGLRNLGNTCFMNSSIQVLLQTPQLAQYLRQYTSTDDGGGGRSATMLNAMVALAQYSARTVEAADAQSQYGRDSYEPRDIYTALAQENYSLADGDQHDSADSMAAILAAMDKDVDERVRAQRQRPRAYKEPAPRSEQMVAEEFAGVANERQFLEVMFRDFNPNESIVRRCMNGILRTIRVCVHCRNKTITYETFRSLEVPISKRTPKSKRYNNNKNNNGGGRGRGRGRGGEEVLLSHINECVAQFCAMRVESLPIACAASACTGTAFAFECESRIVHPPMNLALRLTRSKTGRHKNQSLVRYAVDEPLRIQSLGHAFVQYSLFGVCCHQGYKMDGGHYIANVKSLNNGKWFYTSDSSVRGISNQEVVNSDAILLLYANQN